MINNSISSQDKNTLTKLYFYMQDASIEIESCVSLLYIAEKFINGESYREMIREDKYLVISPSEGSLHAYVTMSRVAFHNIVINIFKLSELFEKKQRILNLIPEFRDAANNFRKDFFTDELKFYRNKYVAHHSDKEQQNDFLSLDQLKACFCKIIGIKEEQFNSNINTVFPYLLKYAENFYSKSNKNSKQICQIIHQSKYEIETKLGCQLNRNISF